MVAAMSTCCRYFQTCVVRRRTEGCGAVWPSEWIAMDSFDLHSFSVTIPIEIWFAVNLYRQIYFKKSADELATYFGNESFIRQISL
jgi:hypothetical protein